MTISGEKSTVAKITLLLVVSFLIGSHSAHAAPFAPAGGANSAPMLQLIESPYVSEWRNEGAPYYDDNCWWQRQRYYANGRHTKKVRNKKNSCPGLAFGADRIQRPSTTLGGRLKY